jgi:hypothetical protein
MYSTPAEDALVLGLSQWPLIGYKRSDECLEQQVGKRWSEETMSGGLFYKLNTLSFPLI